MEFIYLLIIPSIVSFVVSIFWSKLVFKKVVEIMTKMDVDQQELNETMRAQILEETKHYETSGKQVFENLTPNKVRVIIPRFVSTLLFCSFNSLFFLVIKLLLRML